MLEQARERYKHIPEPLKALPNWCIAGPDKAPYKFMGGQVYAASNKNPADWVTFDTALEHMVMCNASYIGFVLRYEDGITCIDLDVKNETNAPNEPHKWSTQEDIQRFGKVVEAFDTYTEVSASGLGAHLWLYGSIGLGVKRDGVEVYSQERFIVCTGQAYINKPMARDDDRLAALVEEIRRASNDTRTTLEEIEPTETDEAIFTKASTAGNADKFFKLFNGEWQGDYPSQSEADLALMSMLTFYSKSNEQCRRMFRASGLGNREKATKNDRYLNFTLEIIRARQQRESIMNAHHEAMARQLVRKMQSTTPADQLAANALINNPPAEVEGIVDWPPGLAGQIANHIYNSAARPVKEVAIVAALGFLAGVCGRAFNINKTGLNLYIILVAQSGVGKEAMHSGISSIIDMLRQENAPATKFVDFTEFASGQALVKACSTCESFVNVSGEWGRRLQRMSSDDRPDSPMQTLRTQMTNLYQKSGKGMLAGGLGYSNADQNIGMKTGVAYSMIGETTPGTFYGALTQSMMEDGFMSRFLVIEYKGSRPASNKHVGLPMLPGLAQSISAICTHAMSLNDRQASEEVQMEPDAEQMLHEYDLECDAKINAATDNESVRQMWNRAHLKVLRLSALLAVSDNWTHPLIKRHHVEWALTVVKRNNEVIQEKMSNGDIGSADDFNRYQKLQQVINEYFTKKSVAPSYHVPEGMPVDGVVPHKYLMLRCSQLGQFRQARNGSKLAIEAAIKQALDNGIIVNVPPDRALEVYAYSGKAYRIVSIH